MASAEPSEAAAGLCCLAAMAGLLCVLLACHGWSRDNELYSLARRSQHLCVEDRMMLYHTKRCLDDTAHQIQSDASDLM